MKIIGITGGVGSGKTALLAYIRGKYNCRIILADEAAHKVKEPGQVCYDRLVALLTKEVLAKDGTIDNQKMAARIFASRELLLKVDDIIHPAVRELIQQTIEEERDLNRHDFLFIEAALLIEGGYLEILDEIWYIYAGEEIRRERLRVSRGYSEEKMDAIMSSQLSEEEFRKHCSVVIDNSGMPELAYQQIDRKLEEYLCQD